MEQVKVQFELGEDGWDGSAYEILWASVKGKNLVVDNYPFFVKGICLGDVIAGIKISEGLYQYVKTIKKSGNSLYRVLFELSRLSEAKKLIDELVRLGCTYEVNQMEKAQLVSINIPSSINANQVWEILEQGTKLEIWEVEEGDDRHPTK